MQAESKSTSCPQKKLDDLQLKDVIPTEEVQNQFVSDLVCLIPRILVLYAKAYEVFKTSVVHHIPHPEQEVMGKKSECVSSMGACWSLIVSLFLVRGWLLFIERGGVLKNRVSQKFNVLMEQFILFLYKVSFRITVLQLK